mmetsp:Transcript_12909/g.27874  ORF Transcript_12909/g.27874 Transcript_12909/m.27874 type:complete len:256 (-) Transcript_12909:52-819(-)
MREEVAVEWLVDRHGVLGHDARGRNLLPYNLRTAAFEENGIFHEFLHIVRFLQRLRSHFAADARDLFAVRRVRLPRSADIFCGFLVFSVQTQPPFDVEEYLSDRLSFLQHLRASDDAFSSKIDFLLYVQVQLSPFQHLENDPAPLHHFRSRSDEIVQFGPSHGQAPEPREQQRIDVRRGSARVSEKDGRSQRSQAFQARQRARPAHAVEHDVRAVVDVDCAVVRWHDGFVGILANDVLDHIGQAGPDVIIYPLVP